MKTISSFILPIIACFLTVSCSKDKTEELSVVGSWKLSSWSVGIPLDLDRDGVASSNLLNESTCVNNEILTFEENGVVTANSSYNPNVVISLSGEVDEMYVFDVQCDTSGSIGSSGTFIQNGTIISVFESTGNFSNNKLTIIYENAINVYNEDVTEIVEIRDLTLVYTR